MISECIFNTSPTDHPRLARPLKNNTPQGSPRVAVVPPSEVATAGFSQGSHGAMEPDQWSPKNIQKTQKYVVLNG